VVQVVIPDRADPGGHVGERNRDDTELHV
jgi:hypothetical protein